MARQTFTSCQYNWGILLVVLSTISWSMAGIFTTAIEGDVWAILFWRSLASGSVVFFYAQFKERKQSRASGAAYRWQSYLFVVLTSLSALCFIAAFKQTSVANVAAIYATGPIFAAWFGWLFLTERINSKILLISAASLTGTLLIFSKSIETGQYLGDLLALFMTLCEAVLILLARKYPSAPLITASAVSSLFLAVFGSLFSDQLLLSTEDIVTGLAFGLSHAFAIVTLIEGARRIPVVTTALLSGLEVPLAAVLAWLVLAQTADKMTLIGGGMIVSALLLHVYKADRELPMNTNPAQ